MDNTKLKAKKPRIKKSYSNSNIFQKLMVDDVRSKILFTVLCLLIYRLGCGVTIPFVNTTALTAMFGSTSVLDYYNLVSGGALSQCAVFAIGVSAYINASIIIQLLTVAIQLLILWGYQLKFKHLNTQKKHTRNTWCKCQNNKHNKRLPPITGSSLLFCLVSISVNAEKLQHTLNLYRKEHPPEQCRNVLFNNLANVISEL